MRSLFAVAAILAACGPPAEPKTVSMRMAGGPPNASVTIDDQFVGNLAAVSARGVALPPGTHRVSVEAAGHFPWDKLVEAKEGQGPIHLDVKLVPVPE
ncbi:MAG: PEGA domain-containing protein [Labilithrix sp.]|nr:PEGA domain-containing protein [Labilithrix sp.]